jgi:hypothetical protein
MAANDMTNALKHPDPEVPFAHVRDDTITSLIRLAEIFKTNFKKSNLWNSLIRPSRPPRTKVLSL